MSCSHVTCQMSHITCHMSCVSCHLSPFTCHLSHVTCHLTPTQKATDPPPANSHTIYSRLVHQPRTKNPIYFFFFKTKQKNQLNLPKILQFSSKPISRIRSLTRCLQYTGKRDFEEGTTYNRRTFRLIIEVPNV